MQTTSGRFQICWRPRQGTGSLLCSNRAICLMKLGHYQLAEEDCNRALELNPDSGKALKTRGKLRFQHLQDWHGALSDLGQAQSIDFDPEVADMLKELSKKRIEEEKEQAKERLAKEEKMRKKAEEIRKVREEEAKEREREQQQQRSAGGMPGMGGMPGGMGGMPGMGGMGGMPGMGGGGMDMGGLMGMMMGDPEIQTAMQNPKVMAAFGELMNSPGGPAGLLSNPAKLQKNHVGSRSRADSAKDHGQTRRWHGWNAWRYLPWAVECLVVVELTMTFRIWIWMICPIWWTEKRVMK